MTSILSMPANTPFGRAILSSRARGEPCQRSVPAFYTLPLQLKNGTVPSRLHQYISNARAPQDVEPGWAVLEEHLGCGPVPENIHRFYHPCGSIFERQILTTLPHGKGEKVVVWTRSTEHHNRGPVPQEVPAAETAPNYRYVRRRHDRIRDLEPC